MPDEPEEIDMSEAGHVAWVKAQRDPALWHQAAMAALAYRGDDHGFLHWLLEQPEMDRATAGWIFLWPEGSLYLRGETDFPLNHISSEGMVALFRALCVRSEGAGFSRDNLGLDPGFEPERKACLDVVARGAVAAGIIVPRQIISRPFAPPKKRRALHAGRRHYSALTLGHLRNFARRRAFQQSPLSPCGLGACRRMGSATCVLRQAQDEVLPSCHEDFSSS